jgi:hypothetical protein
MCKMIELTAPQLTIIISVVGFVVWLIRLEGRLSQEIALRIQHQTYQLEKDAGHNARVLGLEGRILDELRKLESTVRRMEEKLDKKQDKEHIA